MAKVLLKSPDSLAVKVVIVLVLGVQILVLSLVLSVEVLMFSAVRSFELTVEPTVLPPRHWELMCFLVRSIKVLVLSPVLSVEPLVLSPVLDVQAPMLSAVLLILVMGKNNRCGKQQAGERKNGKDGFLQVDLHKMASFIFQTLRQRKGRVVQ